jgi:hypothetical protein
VVFIQYNGPGEINGTIQSMFLLQGPSRVTFGNLVLLSNGAAVTLENVDVAGSRIYAEMLALAENTYYSLLMNHTDHMYVSKSLPSVF